MKNKFFLLLILVVAIIPVVSQAQQDTAQTQIAAVQDDPARFINRIEIFNELMKLQNDAYLNITTARTIVHFGKRFTARLDVPFVHNSNSVSGFDQFGLGDISIRLLGYQLYQSPLAALITSVELSFNTAQSPLLGTGKNMIIPTIAYSRLTKNRRNLFALAIQQYNSISGDENRQKINFSRIQFYAVHAWSRILWTYVQPELYIDYTNGGTSMNTEIQTGFRAASRVVIWLNGGAGIYGDHPARYKWSFSTGVRYLFSFKPSSKKESQ